VLMNPSRFIVLRKTLLLASVAFAPHIAIVHHAPLLAKSAQARFSKNSLSATA
jgi:hypothetical protein